MKVQNPENYNDKLIISNELKFPIDLVQLRGNTK